MENKQGQSQQNNGQQNQEAHQNANRKNGQKNMQGKVGDQSMDINGQINVEMNDQNDGQLDKGFYQSSQKLNDLNEDNIQIRKRGTQQMVEKDKLQQTEKQQQGKYNLFSDNKGAQIVPDAEQAYNQFDDYTNQYKMDYGQKQINRYNEQSHLNIDTQSIYMNEKGGSRVNTHSSKDNDSRLKRSKVSVKNDGNWQQYIRKVFNYYCKSSYYTGKNVTFDRIQKITNMMEISAFVAFCRDFQIMTSRLKLIDIFKKSSNFNTYMNSQQFISSLNLIKQSFLSQQQNRQKYKEVQGNQEQIEQSKLSKKDSKNGKVLSFNQFLKYMHMDNEKDFTKKMTQIGRNDRIRGVNPHENMVKVKPQSAYKFKYNSINGKYLQQIKQEIQQRKQYKKINKQMVSRLREIKAEINANKFVQFNRLRIEQKKVSKGGYMSPPKSQMNISKNNSSFVQKRLFKNLNGKIGKQFSIPINTNMSTNMNMNANNNMLNMEGRQKEKPIYANSRQRNYTQLNSYINSLEQSVYQQIQNNVQRQNPPYQKYNSRNDSVSNSQIYQNDQYSKAKATDSYLNRQKMKSNKNYTYLHHHKLNKQSKNNSRQFSINSVIKQAKQSQNSKDISLVLKQKPKYVNENDHHTTYSKMLPQYVQYYKQYTPKVNKTKESSLQKYGTNNMIQHKQKVKVRVVTEQPQKHNELKQMKQVKVIPSQLQGLIDDLDVQDQYLNKLNQFKNGENQNKRRIALYQK